MEVISGYGDRMASKPTVKRRRLGRKLREMRDAAHLDQKEAAAHSGFSQTKISQTETAQIGISSDDVRTLCEIYGVDPDATESMAALAREAKKRGWWRTYDQALTPATEDFLEVESDAVEVCNFESDLIPGLLQVEEYTRALAAAFEPGADDEVLAKRVELRAARQQRLLERRFQSWAVIGTPALECPVGGRDVQRKQLRRLLDTTAHSNITLQVLPYSSGEHIALGMPFALAWFADGDGVAIIEHLSGNVYLEEQADVSRYSLAFRHLCAAALPVRESLALVRRKLDEL